MPLESCMILLDNSQYMLNGDYTPTRLSAQLDAANLLLQHKTQSNPESTVGVIAMSGGVYSHPESVELLVSPTEDMGKILGALHGIPVRGKGVEAVEGRSGVDIAASVQVASLALKHRKNKNGQQRIVIFVGSPLTAIETRLLVKAGRGLKKNNVAIDIVAMGELEENEDKLKQMVDAANGSNDAERTCHLVTIPPGILPSDVLVGSPIVNGGNAAPSGGADFPPAGGAAATGGGGGGGGGDEFAEFGGVNPNMDPELAMALRVSMEEERARQERIARDQAATATADECSGEAKEGEEGKTEMEVEESKKDASGSSAVASTSAATANDLGDEDALLQQALEMSMAETAPPASATGDSTKLPAGADDAPMHDEEEDEDAAMQMALQMSMQADEGGNTASAQPPQQFQDPQFVNQLLGSLPGVNPNDPAIRSALENYQAPKDNDDDKEGKSNNKDVDKEE